MNISPTITWEILKVAPAYNKTSRKCLLCLNEKLAIITNPSAWWLFFIKLHGIKYIKSNIYLFIYLFIIYVCMCIYMCVCVCVCKIDHKIIETIYLFNDTFRVTEFF